MKYNAIELLRVEIYWIKCMIWMYEDEVENEDYENVEDNDWVLIWID